MKSIKLDTHLTHALIILLVPKILVILVGKCETGC